jgi:hypothetical protein
VAESQRKQQALENIRAAAAAAAAAGQQAATESGCPRQRTAASAPSSFTGGGRQHFATNAHYPGNKQSRLGRSLSESEAGPHRPTLGSRRWQRSGSVIAPVRDDITVDLATGAVWEVDDGDTAGTKLTRTKGVWRAHGM